jgi:hypothetical protein
MSYRPWLDKFSSNDATNPLTPSYFEDRLVAGDGITLTTNNDGGAETITVASDQKALVSDSDTEAGYLGSKLVAGTGMTLTVSGTNEIITFATTVEGGYWEPLITGDTDTADFLLDDTRDILMVQIL